MKKHLVIFSLIVIGACCSPACSIPLKRVLTLVEDCIDAARKIPNITTPQIDELIELFGKRVEDLSPELIKKILFDLDELGVSGIKRILDDELLLDILLQNPELIESSFGVIKKFPFNNWGQRFEKMMKQYPNGSTSKVEALLESIQNIPEASAMDLIRALDGKTVSSARIGEIFDNLKSYETSSTARGDLWEIVARAQLERGGFKRGVNLATPRKIINGQYNNVHGIDGIGVDPDGMPAILEFTTDAAKSSNLADGTYQMDLSWVADRWNKLLEKRPDVIDELLEMGVGPEFLETPIPLDLVEKMQRKVVASSDRVANGLGSFRIGSGLGMVDLVTIE